MICSFCCSITQIEKARAFPILLEVCAKSRRLPTPLREMARRGGECNNAGRRAGLLPTRSDSPLTRRSADALVTERVQDFAPKDGVGSASISRQR
jgi:hypothetical protein